jgi:hypothetical protein
VHQRSPCDLPEAISFACAEPSSSGRMSGEPIFPAHPALPTKPLPGLAQSRPAVPSGLTGAKRDHGGGTVLEWSVNRGSPNGGPAPMDVDALGLRNGGHQLSVREY